MAKVAFLHYGDYAGEGVGNWVKTIAEHAKRHTITLCTTPMKVRESDYAIVIATGEYKRINIDLADLEMSSIPLGILHNEDWGMVPPGRVPHFCWTKTAQRHLYGYDATLIRQPVLPPMIAPRERKHVHLATFGHCEPKKGVLHMARWAKDHGIRFTSYSPTMLANRYSSYIEMVRATGATVRLYDWHDHITELSQYFESADPPVSHFIFDLIPTKGGSGGSSTSARYATTFSLPIFVIDDEDTCMQDGFHVAPALRKIGPQELQVMVAPDTTHNPDAYIDELCLVLDGWVR